MRSPSLHLVVATVVVAACVHQTRPSPSHMQRHYERVGLVQLAVSQGDLAAAREPAAWLAHHDESISGLPAAAALYLREMRSHASDVESAQTLAEAAIATGRLGRTCGACHQVSHDGPHLNVARTPHPGTGTVTDRMRLHLWAADRMWDGLIGPSDSAWTAGALALATFSPYAAELADSTNRDAVTAIASRLRNLSTRAQMTAQPDERAELYGDFLKSCAECHALVRGHQ